MPTIPQVVTPLRVVAHIFDVPILLVSVEIWPTDVCLHLGAAASEQTKRIDRKYSAALNKLMHHAGVRKDAASGSDNPGHDRYTPAEKEELRRKAAAIDVNNFNDIVTIVTDDVGTEYHGTFGTTDLGNGRVWRIDQGYSPGPPSNATALTLFFHQDSKPEVSEKYTINLM